MNQITSNIPFRDRAEIEKRSQEVLRSVGPLEFPLDSIAIGHRLGVPVHLKDFAEPDISGMLVRSGENSEIYVKKSDMYVRQNFTVAHELGHFILHPLGSWRDTVITMYRRDYWKDNDNLLNRRAEYQANLFAAALLMPESIVRERWSLLHSIFFLAPFFRVSKKAMFRRLEELGLIVPSIEGFYYLDISPLFDIKSPPKSTPLSDESGKIPTFPPIAVDKNGRIIPMTQDEREARQSAFDRVLHFASQPDQIDPPELLEE